MVGFFGRDGAPVDRPLLRSLAHYLSFRGPDAREVWAEGPIGFGHTLLRTTDESLTERQPATLEGRYTITADARIDCRADLIALLANAGRKVRQNGPDSELILHAYAAWGEECVEHLRGDFAFAMEDTFLRAGSFRDKAVLFRAGGRDVYFQQYAGLPAAASRNFGRGKREGDRGFSTVWDELRHRDYDVSRYSAVGAGPLDDGERGGDSHASILDGADGRTNS